MTGQLLRLALAAALALATSGCSLAPILHAEAVVALGSLALAVADRAPAGGPKPGVSP